MIAPKIAMGFAMRFAMVGAGRAAGALEATFQRAVRSAMPSINRKRRAGGQPSTQGGLVEQAPNLVPSKLGFEQQWALPNAQEPLFQLKLCSTPTYAVASFAHADN